MKVHELIKQLNKLPQEHEVIACTYAPIQSASKSYKFIDPPGNVLMFTEEEKNKILQEGYGNLTIQESDLEEVITIFFPLE